MIALGVSSEATPLYFPASWTDGESASCAPTIVGAGLEPYGEGLLSAMIVTAVQQRVTFSGGQPEPKEVPAADRPGTIRWANTATTDG